MRGCETWHNTCCLAEYKDACSLSICLSLSLLDWCLFFMSACLSDCLICLSWEEMIDDRFFYMKERRCFPPVDSTSSNLLLVLFPCYCLFVDLVSLSFRPWSTDKNLSRCAYFPHLFSSSTNTSKSSFLHIPSCHKQWILNKFPLRTLTPETSRIAGA